MKEIKFCPVCKNENHQIITNNQCFYYSSEVLECQKCKFCWLKKQLDDDELYNFYAKLYREKKEECLNRMRRVGDLVRSRSQYLFIKNNVCFDDAILEIGAGYGVNANYLYEKGFRNLTISEYDYNAISKYLFSKVSIEEKQFTHITNSCYDVILMSHVLEHLYDIDAKIEKLRKLLKQNGRLFIEIPNNENPIIRRSMSHSYHYLFFTKQNVIDLLKRFKLNIIKIGCFGKEKLLDSLTEKELELYEIMAENDDQFNDIIEMDVKEINAFWLRILVQK